MTVVHLIHAAISHVLIVQTLLLVIFANVPIMTTDHIVIQLQQSQLMTVVHLAHAVSFRV